MQNFNFLLKRKQLQLIGKRKSVLILILLKKALFVVSIVRLE